MEIHPNCVLPFTGLPHAQMIQFSLFHIPIRIQPWFWLTLVLLGGAHRLDSREGLFMLSLFVLAGFISILVHELGHALTAKHFGKQVEIVLQAFGGYAAYSGGGRLSRVQTFLITAAGPAIQIVLGLVALWLLKRYGGDSGDPMRYFLAVLYVISVIWALLNLLPVLPMDGGRLLETVLGPQRIRLTLQISMVTAIVVAVLAIHFKWGGIMLPVFMGFMAYESYKALKGISWR